MFRRRVPRRLKPKSQDPEGVYQGLRSLALDAIEHGLARTNLDFPSIAGVVVDVPSDGGFATFVALADGTTSMYTSTGGGTIGAGSHPPVAEASRRLLHSVQQHRHSFNVAADGSLPPHGSVFVHALMPGGVRRVQLSEEAFWGTEEHSLAPMLAHLQNVITALRSVRS